MATIIGDCIGTTMGSFPTKHQTEDRGGAFLTPGSGKADF